MHRVDYMTIDTEGSEALIIDDFPWRQFDVRVVQVEQLNETRFHSQAGKQEQITRRLVAEGYKLAHVIVVRRGHTEGLIFVKNSSSAAAADANAGSEAAVSSTTRAEDRPRGSRPKMACCRCRSTTGR